MCDLVVKNVRLIYIVVEVIKMCVITSTEFKRNFGKYVIIGQTERIQVTHRGKVIFTVVPEKEALLNDWESFFGSLPKEALIDDDISRE